MLGDIAKAGRLLGWKPLVAPHDGFRRTVQWDLAQQSFVSKVSV